MSQIGFRIGNFNNNETVQAGPASVDIGDVLVPRNAFSSGGLWGCGFNVYGQLGDNSTNHKSSPVQTVAGGTNWKQVTCGYVFSYGIKTDGTLWAWGRNDYAQLGNNSTANKSSPVQTIAGGTNWKQVGAGYNHFAAIKTDGTLWCCGSNTKGQLGTNSTASTSSPVQTVTGGSTWQQVSCGNSNMMAIKTDGTLWACGYNVYGQLGNNSTIHKSSPVQTIAGGTNWKYTVCGKVHTIAIKTDGTLWTWGRNDFGQLGDNTIIDKSSPVQTVTGGTNWKQVSCGVTSTTGIKMDGTLWIWGQNNYGQLGDNTVVHKSSPVQTIAGGTNWKQVSCGNLYHTTAIKTDGTLWCWGLNSSGQLGDNTTIHKSSPVQTMAGGTNWKQINNGASHWFAISE